MVGNFLSSSVGVRCVCEDLAVALEDRGWSITTTSDRPRRFPRLMDMLRTIVNKRRDYAVAQVDVYSGAAFFWAEAACFALRTAGKPYVLTLHGGNLPNFARRWPRRVRRLLNSAALVTTPSQFLRDAMRRYRAEMKLLPNPLDLQSYQFRLRDRPEPRLMWLRSMHQIYNPTLAPRVVEILAREFPGVRLTMVGPDKGDGSVEAVRGEAKQREVGDRLRIVGGVAKRQVPEVLQQGDIFLNTTNTDNTPVSVLEAMACGLCVVSTDVGGIPYLLDDGADSLLCPPNDAKKMADAVARLLRDADLARRISTAGRRKAEQFDRPAILSQWEQILSTTGSRCAAA